MNRVFADKHFFIALLSERDADHHEAAHWLENLDEAKIITTGFILLELADGMNGIHRREICAAFFRDLMATASIRMIEATDNLMWRGFDLYSQRPDKDWSLTDCTSFVVMNDEGVTQALTADRHFEQAGFAALLARRT
jgi:uncharacterized protein